MGSLFRRNRTKGGKTVKNKTWSIKFKDERGKWVIEPAYTDKQASAALLKQREVEVARRKAGLPVVEDADKLRSWEDVMALFLKALVSKGSEPEGPHVRGVRKILRAVGTACQWHTLADVRKDTFSAYLDDLATNARSPQTRKNHLAVVRSLLNWCVEQGWLGENPIKGVKAPRIGHSGKRRLRRAYTREELFRLLAATPEPRRTLYRIAALSGYRRKELARMQRQDVTPTGPRPHWHLRATAAKNGRCDLVPIVPDLLPDLLSLWSSLPSERSLVVRDGLGIAVTAVQTLYADLERAGISRVDGRGRHADFHSFRYTFCRLLGEWLPIQVVKVYMRHATISLTADLYGQLGIEDLGEKVWNLPPILGTHEERKDDQAEARPPQAEADRADPDQGEQQ